EEGGAIKNSVVDWLVKYQGKDPNDAKASSTSFSPPNLIGEGQKVQTQWLFDFIHKPETIRPWLSVRMPTYYFDASQINTIVKYFSYLDQEEFPFVEPYHAHSVSAESLAAGEKLFSKEYFGCASCHIVGNTMPSGSADSWAPNFALASKRLKPEWIIKWITNPPALLPGTKMPAYYDPKNFDASGPEDVLGGEEHAQIKALRDYLMTLSNASSAQPVPTSSAAHPVEGSSTSGENARAYAAESMPK
ncbi:MAG: c-type cytochrome, partial [Candidatus Omnitrophica bacterium]|nr:c-type cytochrome [Candidatus Omnitrophota bacterium]